MKGEPTAYGRAQKNNRRQQRLKKAKSPRTQAVARGVCGGKKQDGTTCQAPAGAGTTHKGIGKCRFHGGNAPTSNASAAKVQAVQFMGAPKDISPLDAIIWCIRITAGEVEWLSSQIAAINEKDEWYEHTVVGKQMNVLVRFRAEAQDRLVKYSKDAISLGLAERAVRLAEQFGQTIARLLEGIRADMELTKEQSDQWAISVRKHLIIMQGGAVQETGDPGRPLVAIPRRVGVAVGD
jgi:hypothetical protein